MDTQTNHAFIRLTNERRIFISSSCLIRHVRRKERKKAMSMKSQGRKSSMINWDDGDPVSDFTTGKPSTTRDDVGVFTQPSLNLVTPTTANRATKGPPPPVLPPLTLPPPVSARPVMESSQVEFEPLASDASLADMLRDEVRRQQRLVQEKRLNPKFEELVVKCKQAAKRRETFLRLPVAIEKELRDMFEQSGVRYYEKMENGTKVYYLDWGKK
jgi:hypothetical protein